MKTRTFNLVAALAAAGLCLTLAACGEGDGASGQAVEPKLVNPDNVVTPGAANFSNPEQRDGS